MVNIPIYRAKKIDSDEWVEGYLTSELGDYFITKSDTLDELANIVPIIDPNTLAIHFPNMIDKNGKKIFASLSEDGVGGDILECDSDYIWLTSLSDRNCIIAFDENSKNDFAFIDDLDFKIIGIKKANQ